ncbi:hypothetical protein [Sneathiella marina]|nr:hypothetical protein [Sneathiella marina]
MSPHGNLDCEPKFRARYVNICHGRAGNTSEDVTGIEIEPGR